MFWTLLATSASCTALLLSELGLWLPAALGAGLVSGVLAVASLIYADGTLRVWRKVGYPSFVGPMVLGLSFSIGLAASAMLATRAGLGWLLAPAGGAVFGVLFAAVVVFITDALLWMREKRAA